MSSFSGSEDPLEGHSRFRKVKQLNRGSFGVVVLAEDRSTRHEFALKFLERGPQAITPKYVKNEIVNHMRLRHPHIISLKEVFLTERHLVLVMEFAAGGDLFSYVQKRKRLSEEDARWFFQQLICAVDYCHKMGVANRDIKLENTLLDGSPRPLVKLCDFGFSKDQNMQSMPHSRVGTPAYLPPEVITAGEGSHYSGPQADVWSLGVLLYVMVTGDYPFNKPGDDKLRKGEKLRALLQRIQSVQYTFPGNVPLSENIKDLISKILVANPKERCTVSDIAQHPWFTEGLSANVLDFNDRLVQNSAPVNDATLREISTLVYEASYRANEVPAGGVPPEAIADSALIDDVMMNASGM